MGGGGGRISHPWLLSKFKASLKLKKKKKNFKRKENTGQGEKCLQGAEDLSSFSRTCVKKHWAWWHVCNPCAGEVGTGGFLGLAGWAVKPAWLVPGQ